MNNAIDVFISEISYVSQSNRTHRKIILGEDATIEFKREMPHRNSRADEIAAFANTQGGVILIGVDDNSEIVGLELNQLNQVEKKS